MVLSSHISKASEDSFDFLRSLFPVEMNGGVCGCPITFRVEASRGS